MVLKKSFAQEELTARDAQCQTHVWERILTVQLVAQSLVERTRCNAPEDLIQQEDAPTLILVYQWNKIVLLTVLCIVLKENRCALEELIQKDAECQILVWECRIAHLIAPFTAARTRCIVLVEWTTWDVPDRTLVLQKILTAQLIVQ